MYRLRFLIIPLAIATLISCKESKKPSLVGKWQEIEVANPDLDETLQSQRIFADTVGTSTTAEQNLSLYGAENIDSFRHNLKVNLDSFRKSQAKAVAATQFDFREGGVIYIHSKDGVDSSNWYVDEDGALILDETKLKGLGNKIRMEIVELTDSSLKLHFTEKFLNSTAIFRRAKK